METIGKIRRWHRVDKLSISKIAKRLSASRNTIAKYLDGEVTKPRYKQRPKRAPGMGAWVEKLEAMLAADAQRPRKEQRTAQRLNALLAMIRPTIFVELHAHVVPPRLVNRTTALSDIATSAAPLAERAALAATCSACP